ncbi:methylmalonyl Co-A mutase-associated GTPase MeaB [Aromatoleum evansii]|uniref:methylmalonyl Co-A mutase-associated GTPase MeaB n=1 Tax=Aromatoleum evansii TaxID=59406 RepID=UPI0016B73DFE|nr:methylmalonyl Co-A mutase-associated GTPase MeaB [Aromatoleum evansii]NMG30084.1 methylmalonyl Co-A mutase-associated GTPase MeaB [Aromatoleum evansii]
MVQPEGLAPDAILAGSRAALARALTAVENDAAGADALLASLAVRTGRAHVVGITGAPGAGKSTLINALLGELLARGKRVAVVAVDPSSPVSGGALLGDRVRMGAHGGDERVFIRSLSSRGHLGGLSRTTARVVDLFDAAGFDVVVVETVGVGQSEVEIAQLADTRIVVCAPGLGDEVQAIKAGVLEIADILVVNKADSPLAAATVRDLEMRGSARGEGWQVPVLAAVATSGEGVTGLADRIDEHARVAGVGRRRKAAAAAVPAARAAPATDDELFAQLERWRAEGRGAALATVVRTWGSSPRPEGSHLAVEQGGAFVGSVSGGCIEGAVIGEAQDSIADGKARLLEFGVSDEQAWEVGLACGGRVQVLVERVDEALFGPLLAARHTKRPVALVTRLADGAHALVFDDAVAGELRLDEAELAETRARLAANRSGVLAAGEGANEGALFVRCHVGAPRMIIVGAVHITQALAPMAAIAGFDVIVVDPRRAFATPERLPNVEVSTEWPDEALERLKPDAHTAIVTLTHDPKLDDPALTIALASPAFYIGSLGSTRTHAKRVARLTEAGLAEAIPRIRAPVGLALGGRAPAEIAVAILAEVIQARHRGR